MTWPGKGTQSGGHSGRPSPGPARGSADVMGGALRACSDHV